MKIKKKPLLLISLITTSILTVSTILYFYLTDSRLSSTFTVSLNADDLFLMQQDSSHVFIFDTGADCSLLFSDTLPEAFFNTFIMTRVSDSNNKTETHTYYYTLKATLGWLGLERFHCILYKEDGQLSKHPLEELKHTSGILGTNIILRYNWLLDFNAKTIRSMAYHETADAGFTPDFILPYEEKDGALFADITIDDVVLRKVKIDTGMNEKDMAITPDDVERIARFEPTGGDTAKGLYSSRTTWTHSLSACVVNGLPIDSLTVTTSPHSRLLGASFFRRFSSVFIDTKRRTIACKL